MDPDRNLIEGGPLDDFLLGTEAADEIRGYGGDDTLLGRGGDDLLIGGDGADRLNGGPGDDTLLGGPGDDVLYPSTGADVLDGGAGWDELFAAGSGGPFELTPIQRIRVDLADEVMAVRIGGIDHLQTIRSVEKITGTSGGDLIFGSDADEEFWGLDGDDVLWGRGGDDVMHGGAGADTFVFGPGGGRDLVADFDPSEDRLDLSLWSRGAATAALMRAKDGVGINGDAQVRFEFGGGNVLSVDAPGAAAGWRPTDAALILAPWATEGDDVIRGTRWDDRIEGLGGNDLIRGRQGDDVLIGGAGRDHLIGGAGDDVLRGGTGGDLLIGGAGNDVLYGGGGADRLEGGARNDVLYGGDGDDLLIGGRGRDVLYGGPGRDQLMGGPGRDRLEGGPGADRLRGGADEDVFVFDARSGKNDRIMDWEVGIDRIEIVGFTFDDLSFRQVGADVRLRFGESTVLVLGTDRDDLGPGDFIFV